jgi:hypothetical protein
MGTNKNLKNNTSTLLLFPLAQQAEQLRRFTTLIY